MNNNDKRRAATPGQKLLELSRSNSTHEAGLALFKGAAPDGKYGISELNANFRQFP